MIDLKNDSVKEIASFFSNEVNSLLFHPEKIAKTLLKSREMHDLDICWIKILSSPDYKTDLRNEASAIAARQLVRVPFIKSQLETISNTKMAEVAETLAREHRTLQQSFSWLVYYHLIQTCSDKEMKLLSQTVDDSFFHLPLI